jgi:phosphatidylinositol alpha-1,6-mannosyltransferase
MATGLPVVTTRCGTNDEAVIPGNLLVEDSAEALADGLVTVLTDRALRASVGRVNRLHVETHHDLTTQCERMGEAFADVEGS